jgi:hypothetical protein
LDVFSHLENKEFKPAGWNALGTKIDVLQCLLAEIKFEIVLNVEGLKKNSVGIYTNFCN